MFIKVTPIEINATKWSGKTILRVNVDYLIGYFEPVDNTGKTRLTLSGYKETKRILVKESIQEIDALIEKGDAKVAKLLYGSKL